MNVLASKTITFLCVIVIVTIVITYKIYLSKDYTAKLLLRVSDSLTSYTQVLQQQRVNLTFCPEHPPNLRHDVQPEERWKVFKDDPSVLQHVQLGGSYKPQNCLAKQHTAIVIPYRDREEHLRKYLIHIHQFLQKQQLHYRVFVAEMTNSTTFNTGLMQNVGFITADKADNFTCFIIHDVDLLPTNENNLYKCDDKMAILLAVNNSKFGYKALYGSYFGGAVAVTRDQFYKTNGYSNIYFGWGGQDDDFSARISHRGIPFRNSSMSIGVVKALPHALDKGNPMNPKRFFNVGTALKRIDKDGLNSLQYKVIKQELKDLYTWILVEVDRQQVMKDIRDSDAEDFSKHFGTHEKKSRGMHGRPYWPPE